MPSYNAYSIDGDVTAELVYVNRGIPEDYEELERRGIDVRGKIVIARYGGSWRGIKPKVAAERGAVGCLLYSDPSDDGFGPGDAYPRGGYRPEQGVQRGSVADMPLFPGDPLTPFEAALPDARRFDLADAPTLTRIPVLPLSWADAKPLLEAMGGPVAPAAWRGGLPLTYHLGPGPAKVRLALQFDWSLQPAFNVIARWPGSELPDQWIVRGNHHDAWVNGAADPVSGMVAVMEEARVLAEMARAGRPPRRTVIYAAWDAEEPGLIGSTEWAEQHSDALREHAVAYVNSDSNSRGFLRMGGSHSLERLMNEVIVDVEDPRHGVSVGERLRAARAGSSAKPISDRALAGANLSLASLGSGSDYTPFLQHLGIASLNLGFGGEGQYGQYHSIYDSIDHFERFMDPDFSYGRSLVQVAGRVVLRLANADTLPFEFTAVTRQVEGWIGELEELLDELRSKSIRHNRLLEAGYLDLIRDLDHSWSEPAARPTVPFLNLAPLLNAAERLEKRARLLAEAVDLGAAEGLSGERRAELDRLLFATERLLTRDNGLPRRPWFRHYLYAPGFYTGYGVKTLPAVREAIEQGEWAEAEIQVGLTAAALNDFSSQLEQATKLLGR